MDIIKLGIIGGGRIGKLHAENILYRCPQFKLWAISDPYPDLDWLSKHDLKFHSTIDDLLADKNIDAVLICSPSMLHADHIIRAALANKHIFCEKPVGLNESEIIEAIHVLQDSSLVAQVGFNRRFDPNVQDIHRQCQQHLQSPHMIKITSRDPEPPKESYIKHSGGIFIDMSIHDFDMARFLSGAEVCEVMAIGAVNIDPIFERYDDFDTAVIQLKFTNGAIGVIDNSRRACYGYDQRVEVYNHRGTLISANVPRHNIQRQDQEHCESAKPVYFFLERYKQAFIAQLDAFHHSISEQKIASVSLYDGLQAVRIAIAAKRSAREKTPIKISTTI